MGLGRNTPWLSHSLTLLGQTHQTIQNPSAWTTLGLVLATLYCLNPLTIQSITLDAALGSIILVLALVENIYTAATTTCPTQKANTLIASSFLTLVAIMAQTAAFAPTFSFYLAASLFSLISLKNAHTLGCSLLSLLTPSKPPASTIPNTTPPHKAAHIQPQHGTKPHSKTSGATTKQAPHDAPKLFPLAGTAPKKRGWPPQTTPNRRG